MTVSNRSLFLLALVAALAGCSHQPGPQRATLAELDQRSEQNTIATHVELEGGVAERDAKSTYYEFIRSAGDGDSSHRRALARLADLELRESDRWTDQDNYREDERYRQTLERTIELLETALREYPEADGNDRKYYQLAKSYDQLGQPEQAHQALKKLAEHHPDSGLYAEAQFRLAEAAFSHGDYLAAEVGYTASLHSSRDTGFHERALFKRGWARYKQSLFEPAIEDFIAVIHSQSFPSLARQAEQPLEDDQALYDEYYRSLALSMVHYPEPDTLVALLEKHGLSSLYDAFYAASDILREQERVSDAVAQWRPLLAADPEVETGLRARAQMVTLWRQGGFHERALEATRVLYREVDPYRNTLVDNPSPETRQLLEQLREHWREAARYYHARFQDSGETQDRRSAQNWYQRYLEQFEGFARQDGMRMAYGDLLAEAGDTEQAFRQYEQAGFDDDVILDADAAYAALALLDELTGSAPGRWLDRYQRYAPLYTRLHPEDESSADIALNVAGYSVEAGDYDDAIDLAQQALQWEDARADAYAIMVHSHLEQEQFAEAETTADRLLDETGLSAKQRRQARDQRALSLYRQAEAAEAEQRWTRAIDHYRRIHEQDPEAGNAARGLYNALSLAVERENWDDAVTLIHRFQSVYPDHRLRQDAERHLSKAYVASGRKEDAARQYERLATSEDEAKAQRAAQWQAARLYREEGDKDKAINAYRRYAHRYPDPYPQNAEAMHRLIELYRERGVTDKRQFWERKLLNTDRQQPDAHKTDRTRRLAASAAMGLARAHHDTFAGTPLRLPLEDSLARKTDHLQKAVEHYARAASYGLGDISSEATHRIGRLYETLAEDLLDSDRPEDLSEQARTQYDILLEDRAFPFEDKAIEFYERNLRRGREEGFNEWLARSRQRLETLFPVRYARQPKAGFEEKPGTDSGTDERS